MSSQDLLNGYDMVVALTQKFLNSQLSSITQPVLDPSDPPPPTGANTDYPIVNNFTVQLNPDAEEGSDQAYPSIVVNQMSAPTVAIKANNQVDFTLHILDGVVQYIDLSAVHQTESLDGVDLTFSVDMSLATIDDVNNLDATSSSIGELQGFQTSDFTIQFLALEFESSQMISTFNVSMADGSDSPYDKTSRQYLTLVNCLATAYGSGDNDGTNPYILGYPISSTNPDDTNPTLPAFAPTSCEFSTTPNSNSDALSTLNYNLMTQNRDFPTDANRGIYNQPWVTDAASSGMMTFDNELFGTGYVEAYVLPIIKNSLEIGSNWTQDSSGWHISADESGTHVDIPLTGDDAYADYDINTGCDVSLSNGDGITITASGSFEFSATVTRWDGLAKLADIDYVQPWVLTITLNVGTDGQLNMSVDTDIQDLQDNSDGAGFVSSMFDSFMSGMASILNSIGIDSASWDSMTDMTTGVATDQLNDMANSFQDSVVDSMNVLGNQYVLPAGDVFYYNSISLNSENDVQTNIAGAE